MVAHDVKVYVKGTHVYSRDTWVNELGDEGASRLMPTIGYDATMTKACISACAMIITLTRTQL